MAYMRGDRWVGFYRDAMGKQHTKQFHGKRDADLWEQEQKAAIRTDTWVDPRRSRMTAGPELPSGPLRRAAVEVGLAGLTPHELRHTAASLEIASGASVKAVQSMLGHASAQMTLDRYGHLFPDELDAVADRLDAARADQVLTKRLPGASVAQLRRPR